MPPIALPEPISEIPELVALRRAMSASPYQALRELVCEWDGAPILRGIVRTWYLKQLAQETARKCVGCVSLVNEIDVVYDPGNSFESR